MPTTAATNTKQIHEQFWKQSQAIIKEKGPVSRHLQEILLSLTRQISFKSVLDVGCGRGTVLKVLAKHYPKSKFSGVDIAKEPLKEARVNLPQMDFQVLDIAQKSLTKKYDLVICLDVIEHIEQDLQALKNIRKMVGKYLILSTIQGQMRSNEGDEGHVRNYAPDELVNKLAESGFTILKVVQWGYPFYSPLYRDILELAIKVQSLRAAKSERDTSKLLTAASSPWMMFFLAQPLYHLMRLNRFDKGDYIFVLAKPTPKT